MKAIIKKVLGLALAASLTVTGLAGCTGGDSAAGGTDTDSGKKEITGEQTMGRYLEEEVSIPEGLLEILDMAKLEDGRARLLGMDGKGKYSIWDSKDGGSVWEKTAGLSEDIFGGEKAYISTAAISPTGDGFLSTYNEDSSMGYYHISEQGEATPVNIELGNLDRGDMQNQSTQEDESTEGLSEAVGNESQSQEDQSEGPQTQIGEAPLGVVVQGGEATETGEVPEDGEEPQTGEESQVIVNSDNSNAIKNLDYSEEGKLYGADYMATVMEINPDTGAIEKEIPTGENLAEFGIAGNTIITKDYDSNTVLYDARTGEPMAQDEVLADGLKDNKMDWVSAASSNLYSTGDEENSIYYCNSTGLYRHVIGGAVQEQLIDGALNSLGSPDTGLSSMVRLEDNSFLVGVMNADGKSKMLKFTYSKDTPTKPSKELKVYSLRDNMEIRQAISLFQKENSDYFLSLEIGVSGDDGATASDALKTLNAAIMAGKGPDILVLDGMPIQSYIEKGVLADLSGILENLKKGDGYFENIADTYSKDGTICAIPSRFRIPLVQADKDTVASATDLTTFADKMEQQRKEDAQIRSIISVDLPEILIERLYQSYSPALVKEDGSLDQEKVKEFYTQLKRISDTGKELDEEMRNGFYASSGVGSGISMTGISMDVLGLLGAEVKASIGTLESIGDLNQIVAANEKMGNMEYGLQKFGGKAVYCPGTILGINSKSSQLEDAEKFLGYVLGKEAQTLNQGGGFPINRAAFDASCIDQSNGEAVMGFMSSNSLTGVVVSLDVGWADSKAFETLKTQIESLDTASVTDETIKDAVIEQGVKCLNEGTGVDDAVNALMQKINLYLAE